MTPWNSSIGLNEVASWMRNGEKSKREGTY
jgi:hypothetical protein